MSNFSVRTLTFIALLVISPTLALGSSPINGLSIHMVCSEITSSPKSEKFYLPYSFKKNGKTYNQSICLLKKHMVSGADLKSVKYEKYVSDKVKVGDLKKVFGLKADSPEDQKPYTELRLVFHFNKKGAKNLEILTREGSREIRRERIAVVVNGDIKSLAVVAKPILDGHVIIVVGDEEHAKKVVKEIKRHYGL